MAISTAKEIVKLKMPSLALPGADDARVDDFISLASFIVAESIFADKYQYALALVVAHQLTLDAQGGGNSTTSGSGILGGITSEKEGDLSRNYAGMSSNISERSLYFMSTPFGRELLQLWNACILTVRNRFVSGR
ncbi:MAG: DUF4054 domain-containing protein [Scytonema sp. CRU_2_7]|nr:DUF4054 domain-containing protein [Scytonema sp. CRU_2_7]